MRRLSVYATWLAVRAGWSANAVTAGMIVVGLLASALIAVPGPLPALAGALLIQLYLLLDCVDGEVARWRSTESLYGIYLDRLGHYLVEASVVTALGVRASLGTDLWWIIGGLVGAVFVLVTKAETDLVDVARQRSGLPAAPEAAATMRPRRLAAGRRLAAYLPLHRVVHAIEASLLVLGAAVVDALGAAPAATRLLAAVVVGVAGLVAVLHLVSVLVSRRLVAT